MSRVILSYQNRVDEATILSYGLWSPALPLTNIKSRVLSRVARTTTTDETAGIVRFTLPSNRLIGAVAIVNHNFSVYAQWRYRVFSDSTYTTTVYDSGLLDVWASAPAGSIEWEEDNFWSLRLTEEDRKLLTATVILMPTTIERSRYYQIDIIDPTNSDGFLQFGRLFIGKIYQPQINMSLGASVGYESRTLVDESISGAEFFDRRNAPRVARFELALMDANENYQNLDIAKISDTEAEVLFVYDSDDYLALSKKSFMGRLRALSLVEQPYTNYFRTSYEIKELL